MTWPACETNGGRSQSHLYACTPPSPECRDSFPTAHVEARTEVLQFRTPCGLWNSERTTEANSSTASANASWTSEGSEWAKSAMTSYHYMRPTRRKNLCELVHYVRSLFEVYGHDEHGLKFKSNRIKLHLVVHQLQ